MSVIVLAQHHTPPSRLVSRKGADLLAHIVPLVCQQWPKVTFLIAGDGPKRHLFEHMRDANNVRVILSIRSASKDLKYLVWEHKKKESENTLHYLWICFQLRATHIHNISFSHSFFPHIVSSVFPFVFYWLSLLDESGFMCSWPHAWRCWVPLLTIKLQTFSAKASV